MTLDKLKELRLENGLTQAVMAEELNISKQYYSQIERGERRLTYEMAVKIANILKKTPDQIFLRTEATERRQDIQLNTN